MVTRTLAALAAALAVAPAIASAPAAAQVDGWRNRDNPPTAAEAWKLVEEAKWQSEGAGRIRRYLFDERQPKAARDALARGLADLILADTSEAGAEVRWHVAEALASAALGEVVGSVFGAGMLKVRVVGEPERSGRYRHRASHEAMERVFAALEPPPLCERDEWENLIPPRPGDLGYRPWPPCERNPRETAWCMAGEALHGPEVSKAMGAKTIFDPSPSDPPEVEGLSNAAARWWGRCWDGRHPG